MSKYYDLNCHRLFELDHHYYKELIKDRMTYKDSFELKTDCKSIKERSYFATWPNSKEEEEFPIAYAKLIFKVRE